MNKSDKKTIFFVIATVARVNFILRTDIFRILRDSRERNRDYFAVCRR